MSNQKINLAILGATGNVGRMFLQILEERKFPFESLKLLASEKSAGKKIKFLPLIILVVQVKIVQYL